MRDKWRLQCSCSFRCIAGVPDALLRATTYAGLYLDCAESSNTTDLNAMKDLNKASNKVVFSTRCAAELVRQCQYDKVEGLGTCEACAGSHQSQLHSAGCTEQDIKFFCIERVEDS